jgi:endonuclease I
LRCFALLFFSAVPGCKPGVDKGDSSQDSGEIAVDSGGETAVDSGGETAEPCLTYAELLADCEALALPVQSNPDDYYAGINPESPTLATDLAALIDDHHYLGYAKVWEAFRATDARPDGKVRDLYSQVPEGEEPPYLYDFDVDQCGDSQAEGMCYNREHSYPSSWFGGGSPMKSDLHHLRPTDGYVNNRRGNAVFAPTSRSYWTCKNGSIFGKSSYCGFSGQAFEPVDSAKGDLARGLMYMSLRYRAEGTNWPGSEATLGARFVPWADEVLRGWHLMDPVDAQEIARNEAIFGIQGNRNPLIDHPEWVCRIGAF